MIEVAQQHDGRQVEAAVARELVQQLQREAAVGQAGERIGGRQQVQPRGLLALHGDDVLEPHHPGQAHHQHRVRDQRVEHQRAILHRVGRAGVAAQHQAAGEERQDGRGREERVALREHEERHRVAQRQPVPQRQRAVVAQQRSGRVHLVPQIQQQHERDAQEADPAHPGQRARIAPQRDEAGAEDHHHRGIAHAVDQVDRAVGRLHVPDRQHGQHARTEHQEHDAAHEPVDVLGGAVDDVAVLDHGLSGLADRLEPSSVDHLFAYSPHSARACRACGAVQGSPDDGGCVRPACNDARHRVPNVSRRPRISRSLAGCARRPAVRRPGQRAHD